MFAPKIQEEEREYRGQKYIAYIMNRDFFYRLFLILFRARIRQRRHGIKKPEQSPARVYGFRSAIDKAHRRQWSAAELPSGAAPC